MSPKSFQLKLMIAAITLIYSGFAKADITPFPFYPRVNLYGGSGSNTYGRADAMIPFLGSSDGIVYTDIDAQRGSNSNNYISLGVGGRDAVSEDFLWGGYIFADRISSNIDNISNTWTVFNPGIEYMTNYWDGRLNVYIPTTTQQITQTGLYGDQVNQPEAISFSGHNQYSYLFNDVQEIGPGADLDFGYTIQPWNRLRIHAGGYYFSPKNTDKVHGGEIGAEFPINNYLTIEAIDTYDNVQNNKALVSLRVTLGGADKSSTPTVQDRLLDPVYHNFAGMVQSTAVPIVDQIVETDQQTLERRNIWFFTTNGGSTFDASNGVQNCTYEHPCNGSSFTQSNINTINLLDPNTNFYFNPGSYSVSSTGTVAVTLNANQSMYGRNTDFTLPASSDTGYPTFTGALILAGNNTLDSFALINNGNYATGITISNASNIYINNLQLGQSNTTAGYATGININSNSSATINNSTIRSASSSSNAYGINNSGNLILNNTNISATESGSGSYLGAGIYNTGAMTINSSSISGSNISSSSNPYSAGLYLNSGSAIINDSTITGTSVSTVNFNYGLYNNGQLTLNNSTVSVSSPVLNTGLFNTGTALINNSNITATTSFGATIGSLGGAYQNAGGTSIIKNSTLISTNTNTAGQSYGINVTGGTVTVINSFINANGGTGSNIDPIKGSFTDGGGNTCKINGVVVSC